MNTTIQEKYGLLPQTDLKEGVKKLITIINKTTNE